MQRLNKFIASSGLCSRRKADEMIEAGKVFVNGKVVKELGFQVGPKDKVVIDKQLIMTFYQKNYVILNLLADLIKTLQGF